MMPFIVLIIVTLTCVAIGTAGIGYFDGWGACLAVGLAAMFLLTASAHFLQPRRDGLIAIVPPQLPRPALLVTVTGVLEVLGAIGLLVPPTVIPGIRFAAALGLATLLVAMFPANIRAAGARRHPAAPSTPLGLRTALQVAYVASAVVVAAAG
ncbi:DoxX family protein [Microbacterium esteraromaticum]|uniref:DoxX family protein n=1 Tax=Microbacterium esteraromaticum TaxID=57043 RepID=UPI001D3AFACC|nr:DoxX family protein [Microbacterium esteraromaticum]MBM7466501.1 putative membrane protein [Microbacterium esteraromaticum]